LTSLALQQPKASPTAERIVIPTLRGARERQSERAFTLGAQGKLWLAGVALDWAAIHQHARRQRLPLPTYPFERQRYWIDPPSERSTQRPAGQGKSVRQSDWFYLPTWRRDVQLPAPAAQLAAQPQRWLVLADDRGVAAALVERLRQLNQSVVTVAAGLSFQQHSADSYTLDPRQPQDYQRLIDDLSSAGQLPQRIVHLWSVSAPADPVADAAAFEAIQQTGFYSLIALAQALDAQRWIEPVQLSVIANQLHSVLPNESIQPAKATLLAACRVLPQEYSHLRCAAIDLDLSGSAAARTPQLIDRLIAELLAESVEVAVALRGSQRWVQSFEPAEPPQLDPAASALREGGVYLITGGLGGIGLILAERLARTVRAKLVLTSRSGLPERASWERWLLTHPADDGRSRQIRAVQALEADGAEVLIVAADVADLHAMRRAIAQAESRFGPLNGVIHAAGIAGTAAICPVQQIAPALCRTQFAAKVDGLFVLEQALAGRELDFILLQSSVASLLGGIGHAIYAAANLFMDAFAVQRSQSGRLPWRSIDWELWQTADHNTPSFSYGGSAQLGSTIAEFAMTPEEGVTVFERTLLLDGEPLALISTGALQARIDQWLKLESLRATAATSDAPLHARPALGVAYVAAGNRVEQTIIDVWQELLGIEQVGIHDNFFDLGGNSLLGLKVIARLKQELHVDLPVVRLFEGPTVSALAALISQDQAATPTFEESQSRGERRNALRQRRKALQQ
jgi:acyl transferase domain-containing protein